MIKLNLNPTSLTYTTLKVDMKPTDRLLVLVPTAIDYSAATRRILEIAQVSGRHVQLLGLCKDAAEEPGFRRKLVSMASLLQDGGLCATVKVDIGTSWTDVVTSNYEAGDVVACFAEQHTGLLHRPLSQILESHFKATVYILSGLAPQKSQPNRLLQISSWLGSIGIIIGFGVLQAKVVQLPEGWLQSVLLILSVIPEFGLIWFWNSLFG